MKKILLIFFLFLILITVFFSPVSLSQEADIPKNRLFALGVCPPWKQKADPKACQNAVQAITSTLGTKLRIEQQDIETLLDEQATYQGVVKALERFAQETTASDRVFIYVNVHNGILPEASGDSLPPSGTKLPRHHGALDQRRSFHFSLGVGNSSMDAGLGF